MIAQYDIIEKTSYNALSDDTKLQKNMRESSLFWRHVTGATLTLVEYSPKKARNLDESRENVTHDDIHNP